MLSRRCFQTSPGYVDILWLGYRMPQIQWRSHFKEISVVVTIQVYQSGYKTKCYSPVRAPGCDYFGRQCTKKICEERLHIFIGRNGVPDIQWVQLKKRYFFDKQQLDVKTHFSLLTHFLKTVRQEFMQVHFGQALQIPWMRTRETLRASWKCCRVPSPTLH